MQKFKNQGHTIYHGDVIEVLSSEIADKSIDLVFIDPPYNIGKKFNGKKYKLEEDEYLNWCYQWIDLCLNKLKDSGSMYIMTSTQFMPYFDIYLRNKIEILSRIAWYYDSSGVQAKKYFGSMYEPVLFCVKDKKNYTFNANDILVEAKTGAKRKLIDYRKNPPRQYNTKKVPGNVWEFPRVRYRMEEYENHPTQKPVKFLERIIKASSNEGDLILDPFSGTFTTSYVAKTLCRNSIGIELEDEYVKIGLRRLEISTHFNGQKLEKQVKSYEKEKLEESLMLKLFEEENAAQFYKEIEKILKTNFGNSSDEIFQKSDLLKYINRKTVSAHRSSKARSSFANLYAIYVLVYDYLEKGYDKKGKYSDYEGAIYTSLKQRMNALPFGEKLQNHALNHRLNKEFEKYYADAYFTPILRDVKSKRYWINENLLKVKHGRKTFNIANSIKQIIDAYINEKQKSFNSFIKTCEELQTISKEKPEKVSEFVLSLLEPNVDARTFEIVSYSILKIHYADQSIYWGYELDKLEEENLKLFKTGRTNANDGGIDFVMKPLGRFFQVTETTNVKKYFLDIDKIERYPITFVIKSELSERDLKKMLKEGAQTQFSIKAIVKKYMDAIEELINLPRLKSIFKDLIDGGKSKDILEEIIQQSRVEFNIE